MRLAPATLAVILPALATLAAGCASSSGPTATPAQPASAASTLGSSDAPTGTSAPPASTPSTSASPAAPHVTEFNPPGDIPDNAVFIDHTAPGTRVHFTVPEGWAQTKRGAVTTFTDKYNSIAIEVRQRRSAPTTASARAEDVPELQSSSTNFQLQSIDTVQRQHGSAVHLTYLLDSAPNPVTDKVVRDVALDEGDDATELRLPEAAPVPTFRSQ